MWKRTRAIRKDITQQHLNCRTTAEVLEIVARYHIWCAHALAKEDRSVFSAKINNENLEKTMTSIEQNYQGKEIFIYPTLNPYWLILKNSSTNFSEMSVLGSRR